MKKCTQCGNEYGTGDQVREKFCSEQCKQLFHISKILRGRPDLLSAFVELIEKLPEVDKPEESLIEYLNYIQTGNTPLKINKGDE